MIKKYKEYIIENISMNDIAFLIEISTNYASSVYYDYFKIRIFSVSNDIDNYIIKYINDKLIKYLIPYNVSINSVELRVSIEDSIKMFYFIFKHDFRYELSKMVYNTPMTFQQLDIFLSDIVDNIDKDINNLYLNDVDKHKKLIDKFDFFKKYLTEDTIKKIQYLLNANKFDLI